MRPYEHYIKAEEILESIDATKDFRDFLTKLAQVHATLALVNAQYSDRVIDLDDVMGYRVETSPGYWRFFQPKDVTVITRGEE